MSYQARITSNGQITLPAELRSRLSLNDGDAVEFYFDHHGLVRFRPRRAGVAELLSVLPPRPACVDSDDDAIGKAIVRKDRRSQGLEDTDD